MVNPGGPARCLPAAESEVVPSGLVGQLETYWQSVRRGRPMPSRRDIDPASLPRLLPNVLLLDVVPADKLGIDRSGLAIRFRWRLAGTRIVHVVRGEPTGKWLDQLELNLGDPFLAFCRMTVLERRPTCHIARWQDLDGKTKPLTRGLLPLSEDGRRVNMLIGIIDYAPSQVMLLHRGAA